MEERIGEIIRERLPLSEEAEIQMVKRVVGDSVVISIFVTDGFDRFHMMDFPGNYDAVDVRMKLETFLSDERDLSAWLHKIYEEEPSLFEKLFIKTHGAELEEGGETEEEESVESEAEPSLEEEEDEVALTSPEDGAFSRWYEEDLRHFDDFTYTNLDSNQSDDGRRRKVQRGVVTALRALLAGDHKTAIEVLAKLAVWASTDPGEQMELLELGIFEQTIRLKPTWDQEPGGGGE